MKRIMFLPVTTLLHYLPSPSPHPPLLLFLPSSHSSSPCSSSLASFSSLTSVSLRRSSLPSCFVFSSSSGHPFTVLCFLFPHVYLVVVLFPCSFLYFSVILISLLFFVFFPSYFFHSSAGFSVCPSQPCQFPFLFFLSLTFSCVCFLSLFFPLFSCHLSFSYFSFSFFSIPLLVALLHCPVNFLSCFFLSLTFSCRCFLPLF